MYDELKRLKGETIKAILLNDEKTLVSFKLANGKCLVYEAEGDCCSYSWIEHMENVSALIGGKVSSVEKIDMPDPIEYDHSQFDVLAAYGVNVTTDKGMFKLEYRNDSNGYYGGSLDFRGIYTHCKDNFKNITEDF